MSFFSTLASSSWTLLEKCHTNDKQIKNVYSKINSSECSCCWFVKEKLTSYSDITSHSKIASLMDLSNVFLVLTSIGQKGLIQNVYSMNFNCQHKTTQKLVVLKRNVHRSKK